MPITAEHTTPCVNPICAQPLADGARFCPYCAMAQLPAGAPADTQTPTADQAPDWRYVPPPQEAPEPLAPDFRVLVLRAGEKVWHVEEDEGDPAPGQARPLLVLDEQTTHLAHTDRRLTPEELLERVQALLARDQVPIDVALKPTRWLSDTGETRPRLIASLRGHRYSDIKVLLGVDYLGRWASISLSLATEPEPVTAPPPFEQQSFERPAYFPVWPTSLIVLGVLAMGYASADGMRLGFGGFLLGFVGFLAIVGGIIWLVSQKGMRAAARRQHEAHWEEQQHQRRRAWEQEQQWNEQARTAARLARTFKVDDMRLFSTAMRQVFQSVVDDIVSRGGEVARIEGGQGGFLQSQGVTQAVPPDRQSDATQAGV